MRLRLAALSVALLAAIAGAIPAAASSSDQQTKPGKYYLSLGDSLAFGYQQATFNRIYPDVDASAFHTGYTNDFARLLKLARPGIKTVNYGCPGETTVSFIHGPCPYPFELHNAYSKGSQLATAVDFLQRHPNQVNPITIDLGSNDATGVLAPCGAPPFTPSALACVGPKIPALVNQIGTNLGTIIATLHAASPKSEILVLNLYNPLVAFDSAADGFISDTFAARIDDLAIAGAAGSIAPVADVFSRFNPGARTNPGNAVELTTICLLSAICTSIHDTHPTNAGYAVMALKLWQASGFTRDDD